MTTGRQRLLWLCLLAPRAARAQTPQLDWVTPTVARQPGRPLAPVQGARTASREVRFSWEALDRGDRRVLELSRGAGEVIRVRVEGDGVTLDRPLAVGTWRWRLVDERADAGVATAMQRFRVGAGRGPANVAWGFTTDDDGDGVSDLAFAVPDVGDGSLRGGAIPLPRFDGAAHTAATRWRVTPGVLRTPLGDLDGDGHDDALQVSRNASGPRLEFVTTLEPRGGFHLDVRDDARLWGVDPVGDVDHDGRVDLAGSVVRSGHAWPLLLTAAGASRVLDPLGDGSRTLMTLDAGDVDADGAHDVAFVTRPDGSGPRCVRVVFGASSGPVGARVAERCAAPEDPWVPLDVAAAGDLDGDGGAELAVTESAPRDGSRRVVVHRGGATPFAETPARVITRDDLPDARGSRQFGAALAFADVDGDGRDELWVGDPRAASGFGCVWVFGADGEPTRACGDDERAPLGATMRAIASPADDGRMWVSTAASVMPSDEERHAWLLGGAPARVQAMLSPERVRGVVRVRVTPAPNPMPPRPDELIDATLGRDASAFEALRRAHPRTALGAAMIAAAGARDDDALRGYDAALRALRPLEYLYLEVEGATAVERAFDAVRVGLLTEFGDGFTPPARLCRAMVGYGEAAVGRFSDRWSSGQSGPSEEARGACLAPLAESLLGRGAHADAVADAAMSLRRAHLRIVAPAPIGPGSSDEIGVAMTAVDRIDEYLFGLMPPRPPSQVHVAAAVRRLRRAAAQRASSLRGLEAAMHAYFAGLDARVTLAAELACAARRLRGEEADAALCVGWGRVIARESLTAWLNGAWRRAGPSERPEANAAVW